MRDADRLEELWETGTRAVEGLVADAPSGAAGASSLTGHTGFKGAGSRSGSQSCGAEVVGFANGVPTEPSLYELADVGEELTSRSRATCATPSCVARPSPSDRPEVVFHLAAQALVRASYADPAGDLRRRTCMGTVNVLEAVRTRRRRARRRERDDRQVLREPRVGSARYTETEPLGGHDPYSSEQGAAPSSSRPPIGARSSATDGRARHRARRQRDRRRRLGAPTGSSPT